MNEPPKTLTQAVDDLRLIRQVLDQTATSFRTLAPEFFRMGGLSGLRRPLLPGHLAGYPGLPLPRGLRRVGPHHGGAPRPVRPPPLGPGGPVGLPAGPVHPVAAQSKPLVN